MEQDIKYLLNTKTEYGNKIKKILSIAEWHELYNEITLNDIKLWSPESPYLYDLEISLIRKGKVVDKVKSYTAMRKISTKRDANNIVRIQINNKD